VYTPAARRGTCSSGQSANLRNGPAVSSTNNRNGRPYEEATVENYVFAARALDRWMTAKGIDGDFTAADTAMLNRFLRDYFRQHGQGGTHSQQRNIRHLFSYLAREAGHPHPYTDALHRYSEQKQRRPATLSADFIQHLLEVTGNGRARDFEGARDHAMIRILTEGIRRGELLGMTMSALPDDLIRNPVIRVVPVKGARASGQGRLVLLTPSSARAFAVYLRVRRSHRFADSDWVWRQLGGQARRLPPGREPATCARPTQRRPRSCDRADRLRSADLPPIAAVRLASTAGARVQPD
jgi:integrase/recombinase XerD